MLHLRPRADHIHMNLKTFYCFLFVWADGGAHADALCSALQPAKWECWAQGASEPPGEPGGAPVAAPGVQGSGALTQGTSWSCSPCPVWFPPINRAEASNSESVTLKHLGTRIFRNSSLYRTTPQVHGQSPHEGDPGSGQRSRWVAGVLRAPGLTWAPQGTSADLSFNGVKRSCSWKLRVRCTHRNLSFGTQEADGTQTTEPSEFRFYSQ